MELGTCIGSGGHACPIFGIMVMLLHKGALAIVSKFVKVSIGESQGGFGQGVMPCVIILIVAIQDTGIPICVSGQDHMWEVIPLAVCVGAQADVREAVLHADGDEIAVIGEDAL